MAFALASLLYMHSMQIAWQELRHTVVFSRIGERSIK